MEPDHPRRLFAHHAGGCGGPLGGQLVALTVLYTACLRYGVPQHVISDSGGAFISEAFEGVCTRLGIDHQTIVSTEGQSYMNLMETHFNIQRRLYDYQFSLTRTPSSLKKSINALWRSTTPPPTRACSKSSLLPPSPCTCWGRSRGVCILPRSSSASSPVPSCRAPPIAMAASPCTATTSMWTRGAPDAGVAVGVWPGTASGV